MDDKFIINEMLKNSEFLNYVDGELETTVENISGNDIDLIVSRDTFIDFIQQYFDKIVLVRAVDFSDKQFVIHLCDLTVPLHFHIGLSFYGSEDLGFSQLYSLHEKDSTKCEDLVNKVYCRYRFKPKLVNNVKFHFAYKNKYLRVCKTLYHSINKKEYLLRKFWARKYYVFCHGVDGSGKSTLSFHLSKIIKPSHTYYFGLRRLFIIEIWNALKHKFSVNIERKGINHSQNVTGINAVKNEIFAMFLILEYIARFFILKLSRFSGIVIVDRSPIDLLFSKFKKTWVASQVYKLFPNYSVHLLLYGRSNIIAIRGGEYDEQVTEKMQTDLRFGLTENAKNVRMISCDYSIRKVQQCAVIEILDYMMGN